MALIGEHECLSSMKTQSHILYDQAFPAVFMAGTEVLDIASVCISLGLNTVAAGFIISSLFSFRCRRVRVLGKEKGPIALTLAEIMINSVVKFAVHHLDRCIVREPKRTIHINPGHFILKGAVDNLYHTRGLYYSVMTIPEDDIPPPYPVEVVLTHNIIKSGLNVKHHARDIYR